MCPSGSREPPPSKLSSLTATDWSGPASATGAALTVTSILVSAVAEGVAELSVTVSVTGYTPGAAQAYCTSGPEPVAPSPKSQAQVRIAPSGSVEPSALSFATSPTAIGRSGPVATGTGGAFTTTEAVSLDCALATPESSSTVSVATK